jgi:hypothetical protein
VPVSPECREHNIGIALATNCPFVLLPRNLETRPGSGWIALLAVRYCPSIVLWHRVFRQSAMRFALDKQRHKLADRCPVELRVDVVDHVIDDAGRDCGMASVESLNDLTEQGVLIDGIAHASTSHQVDQRSTRRPNRH